MKRDLKFTIKGVYTETLARFEAGMVKPHIGAQGYLVLMQDKIDRILRRQASQEELVQMAVDAVLALHLHVLTLVPQEEEYVEEEPPSDEDFDDTAEEKEDDFTENEETELPESA